MSAGLSAGLSCGQSRGQPVLFALHYIRRSFCLFGIDCLDCLAVFCVADDDFNSCPVLAVRCVPMRARARGRVRCLAEADFNFTAQHFTEVLRQLIKGVTGVYRERLFLRYV